MGGVDDESVGGKGAGDFGVGGEAGVGGGGEVAWAEAG